MAFWKRGEDPWEIDPAKERERREREDREPIETPLDTLREWREKRRAEAAAQEAAWAAEPAEKCPWCGKDMERGYLITGRGGIVWTPGRMTGRAAWIGPPKEVRERRLRVDNEGFLATYKTTWYCPDCEKMVLDAAGLLSPENTDISPFREDPDDPAGEEEEETL